MTSDGGFSSRNNHKGGGPEKTCYPLFHAATTRMASSHENPSAKRGERSLKKGATSVLDKAHILS